MKTVVDIGGSQGSLILDILAHHPNVTEGINFDFPVVIENNQKLTTRKLPAQKGRFVEVAGNFFLDDAEIPRGTNFILIYYYPHCLFLFYFLFFHF